MLKEIIEKSRADLDKANARFRKGNFTNAKTLAKNVTKAIGDEAILKAAESALEIVEGFSDMQLFVFSCRPDELKTKLESMKIDSDVGNLVTAEVFDSLGF